MLCRWVNSFLYIFIILRFILRVEKKKLLYNNPKIPRCPTLSYFPKTVPSYTLCYIRQKSKQSELNKLRSHDNSKKHRRRVILRRKRQIWHFPNFFLAVDAVSLSNKIKQGFSSNYWPFHKERSKFVWIRNNRIRKRWTKNWFVEICRLKHSNENAPGVSKNVEKKFWHRLQNVPEINVDKNWSSAQVHTKLRVVRAN